MDATRTLEKDHRTVEALFSKFEKSIETDSRKARETATTIVEELTVHTTIEEKILYPYSKDRVEGLLDEVLEAYEEHGLVKKLLADLRSETLDDDHLKAKLKVLKEAVAHHVEEEESEFFPTLRKECSKDELEALGGELEVARAAAKGELQKMPKGKLAA